MSAFELPGGGRALFSDRSHGNMSSVGGDGAHEGVRARARLRETCGVDALVRGYQVHGTVVGRIHAGEAREFYDGPEQPSFKADGHASAAPGLAAMVLAADCLPVVLGTRGSVAALHAGWRGLAAGVLEEGVRALRDVGGEGEIVAVLGPCAGSCCYEVGEEVHATFGGAHRVGRLLDLRAIATERLLAAGVDEVREGTGACTICDERYFSHRREGERAGRQAAVAWLT